MKNFTLILLSACLFLTNNLSAQFAVYTEGYGASATFAPFGGSVNNITEDMTMANAHTGTKSLRAEVPAAGYTGGAIVAPMPQNFTAYTAVTFWVRASASKTLNVAGFANNAVSAPRQTEKANIPVSTTWTKVTIPIPNPAILTAEDGLFHFAEGDTEGAYTLWFDDIQYENIAVVGDPAPTVAAPTPTRAAADVISLFSGSPYTDLTGTNWNPYNGGTGYSVVSIASNPTQKYTNLSYSVSELAANADLTAYSGFHVDFWSATAVNFKRTHPEFCLRFEAATAVQSPIKKGTRIKFVLENALTGEVLTNFNVLCPTLGFNTFVNGAANPTLDISNHADAQFIFTKEGFHPFTLEHVKITRGQITRLVVKLQPIV